MLNCSLTLKGKIKISNIHLLSKDSNNVNDLIVKIGNEVVMKKMIIDKTITVNNEKTLTINESAIYGSIVGSKQYNLDNNYILLFHIKQQLNLIHLKECFECY